MLTPSSRSAGPFLVVDDISRSFTSAAETVRAVRNVSLSADQGEFVCVFGASGSGKSTLVNLIAGLDTADAGRILVGQADLGLLGESGRARLRLDTVGVVFQDHNLIDEFTALENIALPLEALGVGRGSALRQASEQLERVGLGGLGDRLPSRMSGGQRQRVGIARALVGERRVLLADEPTGALDSRNSRELFELVRELCDQGTLAVVCTHDQGCQDLADTVYEMADGRLSNRERVS